MAGTGRGSLGRPKALRRSLLSSLVHRLRCIDEESGPQGERPSVAEPPD
jgi:hypothetical protein